MDRQGIVDWGLKRFAGNFWERLDEFYINARSDAGGARSFSGIVERRPKLRGLVCHGTAGISRLAEEGVPDFRR